MPEQKSKTITAGSFSVTTNDIDKRIFNHMDALLGTKKSIYDAKHAQKLIFGLEKSGYLSRSYAEILHSKNNRFLGAKDYEKEKGKIKQQFREELLIGNIQATPTKNQIVAPRKYSMGSASKLKKIEMSKIDIVEQIDNSGYSFLTEEEESYDEIKIKSEPVEMLITSDRKTQDFAMD
jgi:hypothetical protein